MEAWLSALAATAQGLTHPCGKQSAIAFADWGQTETSG